VIPLRRASDEVAARTKGPGSNRSRNEGAFREILDTVENNGAVLIFPEGKSHNEPGLEPLRSGLARLALSARDDRSVRSVKILPIGLVFEDKGTPRSVVDVHIGNAVEMDSWAGNDSNELTNEISRRLRILSEQVSMPIVETRRSTSRSASLRDFLISIAARWGRITHELPVRFARRLVARKARDADQPAMLTMVVATGLALLVYAISFAVVNTLVHSAWISALFVASLLLGAYWAAFEDHRRA
jgi:hypothetical protein